MEAGGGRRLDARPRGADARPASLGTLAQEIVTRVFTSPLYRYAAQKAPNGPLYQAVLKLNAAAGAAIGKGMAGYYDALVKAGVEFTIMAGGGNSQTTIQKVDFVKKQAIYSDGNRVFTVPIYAIDVNNGALALKVDNIMLLPARAVLPRHRRRHQRRRRAAGHAGQRDRAEPRPRRHQRRDRLGLSGRRARRSSARRRHADRLGRRVADRRWTAASLIGLDGATLIGMDGASLIGADGASLIGMDGASLIGTDGASLIGAGRRRR